MWLHANSKHALESVSAEPIRSQLSTMHICVCACLYSASEERSPLTAAGRLVGRDLQATGRLAHRQLLTLTIEFSPEQLLERNLFKKTKDKCLIYVKKFCI